jgi:endonuclease III
MKDGREYSKKVQRLYRTLKQRGGSRKAGSVTYEEPVDALVYSVVSEKMTEPEAEAAIKKLREYFVDYNDLRVAAAEEITEVLGKDVPAARDTAAALVGSLGAVFQKYNMLSLQGLRKLGKRPAKQMLGKLACVTPFVVDYCMLTSMQGHAIPLTPKMLEYLKANGYIRAEATYEEAEGFLARQIAMKNAYEFYSLLRRESESPKPQKNRKRKSTKKE